MGWGFGFGFGVLEFFCCIIYMFFTTCSIGIGIGFTCAIERLLVMECMEYHSSVVLYVARGFGYQCPWGGDSTSGGCARITDGGVFV